MGDRDSEAKKREDRKLRKLQWTVRLTDRVLNQPSTNLPRAVRLVEGIKRFALSLFPGKERAWEIIYAPRFRRILRERWGYVARGSSDDFHPRWREES